MIMCGSVGDRSSMGGQSGGSGAVSQTQWRHTVHVDGVGRVVQVHVGGTAQRQDRPFLGQAWEHLKRLIRVVCVNCKWIKAKNFTIARFDRS